MGYANVTLVSQDGDLTAVVYLPQGIKQDEAVFYHGTRFDHSSMIGSITRKRHYVDSDGKPATKTHVLYGTDTWRIPHNSNWPESGVGLAAEFGVGDNGAFCFYRCGWSEASDITNGVLGYAEAKIGEPFLKIGVGALLKGTCPSCDSAGDYMFNSPYLFHEEPVWRMKQHDDTTVRLTSEVTLDNYGYRIEKEISLIGDTLSLTTTLTNLGAQPFSTVWYSHNFFSCDGYAVGPGYSLSLNLKGIRADGLPPYEEPDTWSWSTPLDKYAKVTPYPDSINVEMVRALRPGVSIKSLFLNDGASNGAFQIRGCGSSVDTSIPEMESRSDMSMYAFNLYVERGTFSPEPQILMHLEPGAFTTWTQRLVFGDADTPPIAAFPATMQLSNPFGSAGAISLHQILVAFGLILVAFAVFSISWPSSSWRQRRHQRRQYNAISDVDDENTQSS